RAARAACGWWRKPSPAPGKVAPAVPTATGSARSCENLQKQRFVALLDGLDPAGLVDQVEHMNAQQAGGRIEVDPYRARRRGDDGAEHRERISVAQLEGNRDEAGVALAPLEAEDDAADRNVGEGDVDQHPPAEPQRDVR